VKVVGYVRVSSKAQDYASQRSAIEREAAARGDAIEAWYAEKRSGRTLARPELESLRRDIRARRINRLYVFRLDRLTRSGIRDTFEVIEELRAHGCEVVSVADGFALDGPAGEIVLAVMAWAAKMERLAINERISAARSRLEGEGRSWGRPPRLSSSEREKVRALADQGLSVRQIAVRVRVGKSVVQRALSQKVPAAEAS
jgi:DNA invertase Pin-like site-specific DNA recombinase